MKTFEYLQTKDDRKALQETYDRLFKTAEAGDYVNQHLINASMNLKAAIVELDRAINAYEIQYRREAEAQKDILDKTLNALGLK